MENKAVRFDMLFETSWEVCNKIGGIYTVLSTKAKTLQKLFKDKIIFIGPDVWSEENPCPYFIESRSILKEWKSQAKLPAGVQARTGRWNIPGKPLAVLVKFDGMYAVKDSFYSRMWELYRVDSLHGYGDYDEACAFSHAAAVVIEELCRFLKPKKAIAHFDEWTTGMGLLYLKDALPEVSTLFTTHATCMGRSICGNGKPLYDYLQGYDGDQMSWELNMQSKHSLEKAAATFADCFTTVSDITAVECAQLLGKDPDVVTPNGFEENFVPKKEEFLLKRANARKKLLEVASSLTGRKFSEDAFIVATSGRFEYRNKGLDMFLDAMAFLEQTKTKRPLIAFIIVPAWVKEPRADLKKALASKVKRPLEDPVITHRLNNPHGDPVLSRIHGIGFKNDKNSAVTVVYLPCFLDGNDGILNEQYYDTLIGTDATVFPSYYEPWGYTPLESIAFGIPTVTTSLSGFGQWILSCHTGGFERCGVNVVGRGDNNYASAARNIARAVEYLANRQAKEAAAIGKAAMKTAASASWNHFIGYYLQAYDLALENCSLRTGNPPSAGAL